MEIKQLYFNSNELVIAFSNGDIRRFDEREYFKDSFNLLVLPQRRRRVDISASQLHWPKVPGQTLLWRDTNLWDCELALSAEQLYQHSQSISAEDLERVNCYLVQKNIAPTKEDAKHHVLFVMLYPFRDPYFLFGESIHGGMGDRGGASWLSVEQILAEDFWRQHLLQADGEWLYHIIAEHHAERDTMISKIIRYHSQQTHF
ncbi:hypothetical protein L9G15_03515 [Shewanella sp. A3A]|nr:hypothetical protein [Shewanella ferrihydritica]